MVILQVVLGCYAVLAMNLAENSQITNLCV